MGRIAVFIDGGYIDKVLRDEFLGARINFEQFSRNICKCVDPNGQLFRAYYYHCLPYQSNPPTPQESARFAMMQHFFDALDRLPRFEVKMGRLAKRGPDANGNYSFEQKMVDVLFSIDLVLLAAKNQITDIAIIAGDSDFVPAVRIAKQEGVSVWLFHGSTYHNDLWKVVDERVRFDQGFINQVRL